MSTREIAQNILDSFTEEQLAAFISLFGGNYILEEEPDAWDREMIKRAMTDKSESVPLEQAASELGININDL